MGDLIMFTKPTGIALLAGAALLGIAGITGAHAGITTNGPSPDGLAIDSIDGRDCAPLDLSPATADTESGTATSQPLTIAGTVNGPSLDGANTERVDLAAVPHGVAPCDRGAALKQLSATGTPRAIVVAGAGLNGPSLTGMAAEATESTFDAAVDFGPTAEPAR
jgi:hypothetical protein